MGRASRTSDRRQVANQKQLFPPTSAVQIQALEILLNAVAGIDAESPPRQIYRANVPNHFDAGTPISAPQDYIQLGAAVRLRDDLHPAQPSAIRCKMAIEVANCYLHRTVPVGSEKSFGGDVELSNVCR